MNRTISQKPQIKQTLKNKINELDYIKTCVLSLNTQKKLVPPNPNLKIHIKTILDNVKKFSLFFLNLEPVKTQNEKYKESTSESKIKN